jgi:Flp pilus assembly protein TadB
MADARAIPRTLARLYPWPVDPSDDLGRSLDFLGSQLAPETVVKAGYGAGTLVAPLAAVSLVASPAWATPLVAVVALALTVGAVHLVHVAPRVLATARRTRALGDAPALVSRAVLRMRITPTAERAAAFAAATGDGPLAESLEAHVRRRTGQTGSGLRSFTEEWRAWFPAVRRSLLLVDSAGATPERDRERTLDRAMRVVLDGTSEQMTSFANALRGPTTALYAFGVLLPLALVAMLPAVRMAGFAAPLPAIVAVYVVALPAVVLAASVWLLVRRPVTFPPPRIARSHPDRPTTAWRPLLAGLSVGVIGWVLASAVVARWIGPLVALGSASGTALILTYRPMTVIRDRVSAVESGLADALYHVGRRVENGTAVEAAIAAAADEVGGETGAVLADAARRQRQLQVGVRAAFLGDRGALSDLPSSRARSAATLLALAASEGQPAGSAIIATAENLDELAAVERDARQDVAQVTATLTNTAAIFGPLVAGATIALADGIQRTGTLAAGGGPGTAGLGLAVGTYVLLLAVLLTTLSTGLSRGLDRSLVGYRIGWALLSATATFATAVVAVGLFV